VIDRIIDVLAWVLVVWIGIGAFASIYMIDQPRSPLGRGTASAVVILDAIAMWVILSLVNR